MGGLTHATHDGVQVWKPTALAVVPWLRACVTTRLGGTSLPPYESLNLSLSVGDDAQRVHANRARLQHALGLEGRPLVPLAQVHGTRIWEAEDPAAHEGDGWWTCQPGRVLVVGVADCVPCFVWDARTRRLALVHAGWRGTAAGMLDTALRLFAAAGSRPEELHVALGPCIGPCCYPVHDAVAARFPAAAVTRIGGTAHLDLRTANRLQAEAHGLRREHVEADPPCTSCEPRTYFSHRRSGPRTGRMWALAWLVAAALAGCSRAPADRVERAAQSIRTSHAQAAGRYLTSDVLAGRHFASAEADSAAAYLISEMRRAGVRSASRADELLGAHPAVFMHPFSMTLYRLGSNNALSVLRSGNETSVRLGDEWMPIVFGRGCFMRGPVVRVSGQPDDPLLAPGRLAGRIAVVEIRDLPPEAPGTRLDARLYRMARQLGALGATAVVFGGPAALLQGASATFPEQLPPELHTAATSVRGAAANLRPDRLSLAAQGQAWTDAPEPTIPALLGRSGWVEKLAPGDELQISIDLRAEVSLGQNVLVGFRGHRKPDELVVIGAGYDHAGVNAAGDILNGADDNASGTVALLGVASALAQVHDALEKSVLVAFFAGGRAGLLGAEALLHDLSALAGPTVHPVAMLAVRGVGRNGTEPLLLVGGAEQLQLAALLLRLDGLAGTGGNALGIRLAAEETTPPSRLEAVPSRGSEHLAFARAGVPSVLLTDGLDPSLYGQPEDDWALVDAAKVTRVARLVFKAAYALGTGSGTDAVPAAAPGR